MMLKKKKEEFTLAPFKFPINDWDGNGSTDDLYDIFMENKICQSFESKKETTAFPDELIQGISLDISTDDYDIEDNIETEDLNNSVEEPVIKTDAAYEMIWIILSSVLKEYAGLDFGEETNLDKIEEKLDYFKYGWREKCESGSEYSLSPYSYKTEKEYLAVLNYAKRIKERYEAQIDRLTKNSYIDENCKEKDVYTICGVVFEGNPMVFHYKTNNKSIKPGDIVIVPVGLSNEEKEATVVSIGEYLANATPYPVKKTKEIIQKK